MTTALAGLRRYPHEPMFIVLTFTQPSIEPYELPNVHTLKKNMEMNS